ncbi:MAG: hypothetical protein PHY73_05705 [Candidatus Omnitrophica bacterium]|nr:hypothetical protein [Candidatus Omnitrophota bacterium]
MSERMCSMCSYQGNIDKECFKFVHEDDRGKYKRSEFYWIKKNIAGVKGGSYILCKKLKEALKDKIERQWRVSDFEGGYKEGNKVYCFNHEDEDLSEIKAAQKELAEKDYKKSSTPELPPDPRDASYLEYLLNYEAKKRFGLTSLQEALLSDVMDSLAYQRNGKLVRKNKRRFFLDDYGELTSKAIDYLLSDQSRYSYLYDAEQEMEFSIGNSKICLVKIKPLKYGRSEANEESRRRAVYETWRHVKLKLKERIDFKGRGLRNLKDALENDIKSKMSHKTTTECI